MNFIRFSLSINERIVYLTYFPTGTGISPKKKEKRLSIVVSFNLLLIQDLNHCCAIVSETVTISSINIKKIKPLKFSEFLLRNFMAYGIWKFSATVTRTPQ